MQSSFTPRYKWGTNYKDEEYKDVQNAFEYYFVKKTGDVVCGFTKQNRGHTEELYYDEELPGLSSLTREQNTELSALVYAINYSCSRSLPNQSVRRKILQKIIW